MGRSSASRPAHTAGRISALALCLGISLAAALAPRPAAAQLGAQRFVDVIELTDHDDTADVIVQFTCSMHYLTHMPAAEGNELRIQLQPLADCGRGAVSPLTSELPPISGGGNILSVAHVESDAPGQIALVLSFRKAERFVVAQGVDPRGVRIRLFDRARGRGKIVLQEQGDTVSNFAINLDSQVEPFSQAAIQAARDRLHAPVFVSETTIEGQKWYRLRVGPIEMRREADRLLALALETYPRAWLAIGDDAVTSTPGGAAEPPLPGVQRMGADPPLDPPTLKKLLAQAESAMASRDYPTAITVLTKLQRQPEFRERAHVQELLGLAHERAGQLAHAKAEYEEYLRRYPQGEAAERVALRLRILRIASEQPNTGTGGGSRTSLWYMTGGVSQLFRYDGTRVSNNVPAGTAAVGVPTSASTSSDVLFNDVDFLARRHGQEVDFLTRLSAGYSKDFGGVDAAGSGTGTRVSIASAEVVDQTLGLLARLGRQVRSEDGVLGTFDGLFLSYQFRPGWTVNATAGYPVELLNAAPHTDRRFESMALDVAPRGARWDASVFFVSQQFDGLRDRDAAGFELRYLAPHASLIALTDYDVVYHTLNVAALMGTLQLPQRWTVSLDAEERNAPVLATANALIGQPVTTLAALEQTFTPPQIYQMAQDRTPKTYDYSVTVTHPLGDRFQFSVTGAGTETGATPASGGVDAQPSTGLNYLAQAQLYAQSVFKAGDFQVLNAQYSKTEVGTLESVGLIARFPTIGFWRIGPRFTVNRLVLAIDGSTELSYIPAILIDYQHKRSLVQLEFGGELGSRQAALLTPDTLAQKQNTTRYYVSLAYRIGF